MAKTTRRQRGASPSKNPQKLGQQSTAWDNVPDHWQHFICLSFLVLLSLSFFAPIHFTPKSLIGHDLVQWAGMAEAMIEHRQATGEEPLWAPNLFSGMPGYMVNYELAVPQIDNVASVLRNFLWPTSHFLFLLGGAYLLGFYLTREKIAGVLAAVAFGLTTYIPVILQASHNSKFITLAFSPWLLLAFAYALRNPRLLGGLLFAIALAINIRAGHTQITYYMAFILGIWWVGEGISAYRNQQITAFARSTAYLALGGVLALFMVAQPLLAQVEYREYTIRGAATGLEAGALDWSYAMSWSQGFGELVTLLIADAYGGGSLYWGPKPFTGGPHYIGGIVIALAILAIWRVKKPVVWIFGGTAILMILFSLGEHFPLLNRPMFEHFPLFAAFRVPETWLIAVALLLGLLAVFGLRHAASRGRDAAEDQRTSRSALVAFGAVLGIVAVLFLLRDVFFDFQKAGEYEQVVQQIVTQHDVSPDDPRVTQAAREFVADLREQRQDMYRHDAMRTIAFLFLGGLAVMLHRREKLPAWAMQAAVVLLVVVDLFGVGRRYLNEDHLSDARDVTSVVPEYDFDRFILDRVEEAGGSGRFRVLALEQSPMNNARPSFHYESIGGYHGAKLRLYQDYIDHIFYASGSTRPEKRALDLMGARYVVSPVELPEMQVVFQSQQTGLLVLENPEALPRAQLVGDVQIVEAADEAWTRLMDPAVDLSVTAILSEPLETPLTPIDTASIAAVSLTSFSPREIVWDIESDATRLLVVNEVYYPAGWRAFLDGEEVPILRVNYLQRGVVIPSGSHTLAMRFDPASHTAGIWIAGISTLLVYLSALVIMGLAWKRDRMTTREPIQTAS